MISDTLADHAEFRKNGQNLAMAWGYPLSLHSAHFVLPGKTPIFFLVEF